MEGKIFTHSLFRNGKKLAEGEIYCHLPFGRLTEYDESGDFVSTTHRIQRDEFFREFP